MKDVVEKVLGAEREAREQVEKAKNDATAAKAEADSAAEQRLRQARERAAAIVRERLETARAAAAALLERERAEAAAEADAWYAAREKSLDGLAEESLSAALAVDLGGR